METQIQELYKPLFLYVRKRISHQQDAEDLTQDIFYKLSKSDVAKIDNVKSWVYAIAKNTITDYYRKKNPLTEGVEEDFMEDSIEENEVVKELGNCITPFIHYLPEEYRAIMELSELKNVPQKEIAEQLDMNYVTVRSKIQRGRKKLKNIFTECCQITQGGKGSILGYEYKNDCWDDGGNCSPKNAC